MCGAWRGKSPTTDLPNIRAIDEQEMARMPLFTWTPIWAGSVRVEALPGRPAQFGGFTPQCFVHYDGTGVLMDWDFWAGKVLYWAFGCEHEYRELSMRECADRGIYHAGRCWHVRRCTKCEHVDSVDTSD